MEWRCFVTYLWNDSRLLVAYLCTFQLQIFYCVCAKNYENLLRADKIIAIKKAQFFGTPCTYT